jgi:hypothetical protein
MIRFQTATCMHTQNRGKLGKFDYLLVENIDNLGKFACKTRVNYPVITVSPHVHTQNQGKSGKSKISLVENVKYSGKSTQKSG